MSKIIGLLLLVGAALLYLSISGGPAFLYAGIAIGGAGLVGLVTGLLLMMFD